MGLREPGWVNGWTVGLATECMMVALMDVRVDCGQLKHSLRTQNYQSITNLSNHHNLSINRIG